MPDESLLEPPDGKVQEASGAERRLRAATVFLESGRIDEAASEARRAGELARGTGDDSGLARAENLLGEIAWDRGRWEEASRLFGAAREHAEAAGEGALLLWIESNDAAVHADLGLGELARESLTAALSRLAFVDDHPEAIRILRNLGRVLAAVDQVAAADGLLVRAMMIAKRLADTSAGVALTIERARVALAHGDVVRADALLGTASALAGRVDSGALRADSTCLEGEVLRMAGRSDAAERSLLKAVEMAEEAGADATAARAWRELGELHAGRGRPADALRALEAARLRFVALGARARAAEAARRAVEVGVLAATSPPPGPVAAPEDRS
jgi:tetratricopeptide (TPR) repeat protein